MYLRLLRRPNLCINLKMENLELFFMEIIKFHEIIVNKNFCYVSM